MLPEAAVETSIAESWVAVGWLLTFTFSYALTLEFTQIHRKEDSRIQEDS